STNIQRRCFDDTENHVRHLSHQPKAGHFAAGLRVQIPSCKWLLRLGAKVDTMIQIAHPNDYVVDAKLIGFEEQFPPIESCRSFKPLRIAINFCRDLRAACSFIPRSAKASVKVQLLVVTPPQRFHGYFDLFYDRKMTEHESENLRVVLANVMASWFPFNAMVNAFDRVSRYEFDGPLAASEIGLPESTKDKALVKKKTFGCTFLKTANG
ncbi:Hypothetical protein, putative, partial [Bodo saltans]